MHDISIFNRLAEIREGNRYVFINIVESTLTLLDITRIAVRYA